jgi:hypothetical protein
MLVFWLWPRPSQSHKGSCRIQLKARWSWLRHSGKVKQWLEAGRFSFLLLVALLMCILEILENLPATSSLISCGMLYQVVISG